MSFAPHSETMFNPSPDLNISQLYRQSLEPYVDPEVLELAHYQPQPQQVRKVDSSAVGDKKRACSKAAIVLLVAASCLLASGYPQMSNVATWLSSWQVGNMSCTGIQ